jgi:hypothetical protein
MAWPIPPLMQAAKDGIPRSPNGSQVSARQQELLRATEAALQAIASDIRQGLLETVGIESRLVKGDRAAMEIDLPPQTDAAMIAQAIDLENVEAWCENDSVRVGIGPWFTTKDIDQVVLCVTKVVHVLLGLHAPPPKQSFWQRLMSSVAEVASLQQQASRTSKDK